MKKIITLLVLALVISANAQCWQTISCSGESHVAAIKTDGTLWQWGGIFMGNVVKTPTQVGLDNNWVQVASSKYFVLALKADGTLWAWGDNQHGALGNGTTTNQMNPTQIGTGNSWSAVYVGMEHVVAKKTDGTLWTWGITAFRFDASFNMLIDSYATTPTQIGTGYNWSTTKIDTGGYHTLAVKPDGTLWAWGNNIFNQLGNGTTVSSTTPVQIGTDTNWKMPSGGEGSSFAIKTNGKLFAWGVGDSRLGLGNIAQNVPTPITQVGTDTDWKSVDGGNQQTMGLKTSGALYTWGDNSLGQLGDGTTTNHNVPTHIGTGIDWATVVSGESTNYAIKTDGTLFAVGDGSEGKLGNGTNTNISTFTAIACPTTFVLGQNKLLSSVTQYLDGNNVWQNGQGSNYEYDSNNNLISETNLSFWENNAWKISSKVSYTYNASNKVTVDIYQNWNATTNKLENSDKRLNTYTNGNITESIIQNWNTSNSSWTNSRKNTLTWNSKNMPESGLFYNWDGSQWAPATRLTITNNANNKITSLLFEKWDGANWVNSEKDLRTYNGNNQLITDREASWDDFSANWKVTNQTDYILDANGNVTSETYTNASDNTQNNIRNYTYDTSSLMSSFANPFNDKDGTDYLSQNPHVNKVLGYTNSKYGTTTYNYSNTIVLGTEKNEIAKATISVFPNPAKDFLTIQNASNNKIDKVIVTDISGKTILQQNHNTNQVDVQNLAKGMYILQAFSGKEKFTSKFIKE